MTPPIAVTKNSCNLNRQGFLLLLPCAQVSLSVLFVGRNCISVGLLLTLLRTVWRGIGMF